MLARNLLLLSVFAGGCLSGALAVGFSLRSVESPNLARAAQPLEEAATSPRIPASAARDDAVQGPDTRGPDVSAEIAPEPTELPEPASTRSLADVLVRLETAYRETLAEPSRPPETVPAERAAVAVPVRAPVDPAPPPAMASNLTPPPVPPRAETPVPATHEVAALPPVSTRDTPPSSIVHTQQTIHIGDVVQGDVVRGDLYQVQQLALLQYLQLLALSPQTRIVSPERPRATAGGVVPIARGRRKPAFPDSVTNPDNPWGFDFPPPMLAK